MSIAATTMSQFDGYRIREHLGIVRGIAMRMPIAESFSDSIKRGPKQLAGYTEMCEQARQQAYELLLQHAAELGANAVIGVRYDASEVLAGVTEVLCYGTAVTIEPLGAVQQ